MRLPRVLKWRVVKKIFSSFGIEAVPGGKHWMLTAPDGRKYPIPAHGDNADIRRSYIEAARRTFDLTPENGISDEEFYGRR